MLSTYVQGEIKVLLLLLLSLVILISASRPVLSSNLQYHGEKMTNPASRQTCWGPSSLQSRRDFLRILCAERRKQGKREASAKRKWRARGEMTQIARCDLLPERVRWSHLARSTLPALSRKKNSVPRIGKPYNKSFYIGQVCSVKMAGYWPRSFFGSLWTSTSSLSINTEKKELGQYPVEFRRLA